MTVRMMHILGVVALVAFSGFDILFSTGMVRVTRRPGGIFQGCICHGDFATPQVRVWISGPDSVRAGLSALYSISVAKDTNIAAGFNVAAFHGSFELVNPAETDTMEGELTQKVPKLSGGRDTISWAFRYKAPMSVGTIDTLYSVGNSVDMSFDPAGDVWNFGADFRVRVTGPSAVAEEPLAGDFRLLQNFPNPFNPGTAIRFEMRISGFVRLTVLDLTGRVVRTLLNEERHAGMHEVVFSAGDERSGGVGLSLASGIYFSRLEVYPESGRGSRERFTSSRKMLVVK